MSKRKDKAPRHVRLYHWLLKSPAWQSLPPNARAIYIEMAARYNGANNGRISFSVREAVHLLRIGKSTASRELARLQERGFVVITKQSAFSLKTKMATEWRLTEFACDLYNTFATKDFMRWVPQKQNTVPVAGPYGTSSGTVVAKMSRNGTCSGTVDAKNGSAQSR